MKSIGITFGKSTPHEAEALIADASVGLFDFIMASKTLCQVSDLQIESSITREDAKKILAGSKKPKKQNVIATLEIIGEINGDVQRRNHPIIPGTILKKATAKAISKFLRLESEEPVVKLGHILRNNKIKVGLDGRIFNHHIAILGKTGGGKSNAAKIILSQMHKFDCKNVVIDPHAEYKIGRIINADEIVYSKKNLDLEVILDRVRSELPIYKKKDLDDIIGSAIVYDLQFIEKQAATDKIIYKLLKKSVKLEQNIKFLITEIKNLSTSEPLVVNLKGLDTDMQIDVVRCISEAVLHFCKEGDAYNLFIDEAHRYAPQFGKISSLKPLIEIAGEGRKFNCGLVIMSQRPAKVNKNVLSQCNTHFCLKLTNQNDIRQVKESTEYSTKQMFLEVQRLRIGEALLTSPHIERPVFIMVDEYGKKKRTS